MSILQVIFLLSLLADIQAASSKPHILIVLVDDWGWANVGYHRDPPTKEVDTPNFDRWKSEGLELDQHYTYQFCSPTRSSLLSGRLPIHVNDQNKPLNIYNPDDPVSGFAGIPRNMTAIAEKLKMGGYAAYQVGKWHAGGATPDHIPTGRGFETSFGYFNADNDYYTEIIGACNATPIVDLWDTDKPATGVNGTGIDNYEEALFAERVLKILNDHDTSIPLFLYYAPHLVHQPLEVPQRYLDMFKFIDYEERQIYHAMVKYLDDVLGNITNVLKSKGMWDDLLVIVSADNGGPLGAANNYPLKGGKFSDWQGGVRVNAFVSGGYLPENMRGQKTEEYIHIADWYATLCALAGVDPTDDKAAKAKLPPIDSLNMWPLISGQNSTSPRTDIPISYATLISDDYKIITGSVRYSVWTGPQYPNTTTNGKSIGKSEDCGDGCLFNIKDDPCEYENLAVKMPDMLKTMQKKLKQYQATYFNPDRGEIWPGACDTALNTYGGFWGPFLP
jgi:arylsulfatase I/J